MNTKKLIIQELQETPEPLLNEILDFVRFLKIKQTRKAAIVNPVAEKAKEENKYDFSDLKGELSWQGDAVTEQRQLRDEW